MFSVDGLVSIVFEHLPLFRVENHYAASYLKDMRTRTTFLNNFVFCICINNAFIC